MDRLWIINIIYTMQQHIFNEDFTEELEENVFFFEKELLQFYENFQRISFAELIEIFPDAKPYIKKKLKHEVEQDKEELKQWEVLAIKSNQRINRSAPGERWLPEVCKELFILPEIKKLEKDIKKKLFQINSLDPKEWNNIDDGKITEQHILQAKNMPITNFIEMNRAGFAKCPFHGPEKTGSFKINLKTNRWHCFGACNEGGDVIDFIMKMQKVDFIQAVKFLIK